MHGRAQPISIASPVRRPWALWLRLTWPTARGNPLVLRPLFRLAFIHFAHWSLLTRVPTRGGRRLRHPVILFQSNFNGPVEHYVDAFSLRVPWRMRAMWQGAYGFPGPQPVGPFKAYILAQAATADHFWCAYPQASTRMIVAALHLRDRWSAFEPQARGLPARALQRAWTRFVTEAQGML